MRHRKWRNWRELRVHPLTSGVRSVSLKGDAALSVRRNTAPRALNWPRGSQMNVTANFYSYFRDLTGTTQVIEDLPDGATLGELHDRLKTRFPKLAAMSKSTLIAVGVEYQNRSYLLQDGDEVSFFPPVQGG